jgi:hypothetical protein
VIILEIDVDDVRRIPAERDPVVSAGVDGAGALPATARFVDAAAWKVHVFRVCRRLALDQDTADTRDMFDAELLVIARFDEQPKPFAAARGDLSHM